MFLSYEVPLADLAKLFSNKDFVPSRPTVIYIHGWLDTGEREDNIISMRSAYRERDDHNFIAVDWSYYSQMHFPVAYATPISKLKTVSSIFPKIMLNIIV